MKQFFRKVGLLVFMSSTLLSLTAANEGYTLVWSDEFDGVYSNADPTTGLDLDSWNFETGVGANCDGSGNWERQEYTNSTDNIYMENGNLVLKAIYNNHVSQPCNYRTYWTSGRINTKDRFSVKYGKIEARIKLPRNGLGVFPAFWMLGANYDAVGWPSCGEIDIMEQMGVNYSQGGKITPTTLHWNAGGHADYGGSLNIYNRFGTMPADDYFIYGVEWTPNNIRGYVCRGDGSDWTEVMNRDGWSGYGCPDAMKQEFYIILNLAMGGTPVGEFPDNAGDVPFSPTMYIDWIRVYQDKAAYPASSFTVRSGNCGDTPTYPSVPKPAQPSVITQTPNTTPNTGDTRTYSVTNANDTDTYNWVVIGGEIISGQGTNSITVRWTSYGSQVVTVTPRNAGGNGPSRSLTVNIPTPEFDYWVLYKNDISDLQAEGNVLDLRTTWNVHDDWNSGLRNSNSATCDANVICLQVDAGPGWGGGNFNKPSGSYNMQDIKDDWILHFKIKSNITGNMVWQIAETDTDQATYALTSTSGDGYSGNNSWQTVEIPLSKFTGWRNTNTGADYPLGMWDMDVATNNGKILQLDEVYFYRPKYTCSLTAGITGVGEITCATNPTLTVTSNETGLTYQWSNNVTTSTTRPTVANTYSVLVTNGSGCTASASVSITENKAAPVITASKSSDMSCNVRTVTLTVTSGTAGLTYNWSNALGTSSRVTATTARTYTVSATNPANGCMSTATVSVTDEKEEITPIIIGETEFKTTYKDITLSVIGVPDDSRYKWSDNSTLSEMIVTSSGEYSVVVSYGSCSGSATIYIFEQTHAILTVNPSEKNAGTFVGPGLYEVGEKVFLQANPAPYYRFVKWSDGSTQNPRRITMNEDISLIAYFFDELAEESSVNSGQVLVEPDSTNAKFSWPQTEGSKSYSLEIKKDGVTFCTLEFNEYGQLAGIDFTTRAMTKGFQFKVTGLDEDSDYHFSLKAKDVSDNVIASYAGDFSTRAGSGSSVGESNLGEEEDNPSDGNGGEGTAVSENAPTVWVYGLNMQVIVKGAATQTISVYNVVGQLLETRVAVSDKEVFGVYPEGVYIVNVGESAYKVIVK